MAENTPHPPVAPHDDQDLWLVSYSDDDDREMSVVQIAAALSRGEIDANTIVWRDGMPEWKAIAEVDVLKEQLRQMSGSPETQRKRSTVIGGFGPAQPLRGGTPTAPTPAAYVPAAAPAPDLDDDEPTVVQPAFAQSYGSSPNNATPGGAPSRSRHPTSGNTLRIRTGGEPVTLRTPTPLPHATREPEASEPDLDSIPSALLVTATNNVEVEEAVHAAKRHSTTPPLPTRGTMTRSSDPPHNQVTANLPRATLTRDSDLPGPAARITDAPKPPVPKRSLADGADSLSPDDVKSETDSTAPDASGPVTPRYNTPFASVQLRDDVEQVYSADLQKTRPPRGRREPLSESGTPPPFGELNEAAARIARSAQSNAPLGLPVPEPQPKSGSGRAIGWALFGIAAVAGAFTLGKRSSTSPESPAQAPRSVAASASGTTAAPDAHSTSAELASDVSVSRGSEVAAANSATTSLASKTTPTAAAVPAARAITPAPTPARSAALKPIAPAGSSPASDPGNGTTPTSATANVAASADPAVRAAGPFDASAAANALALAANKASACRQPGDPSGIARVTVTFTNSGKSTHALVDGPPFAGTATGSCIAATMRSTTVSPFTGDRVTVKKTVVIQ